MDMKPASQPEHASLNQCSVHAHMMLARMFLCNVNDTRALIGSLFPHYLTLIPDQKPLLFPALHYSTCSN